MRRRIPRSASGRRLRHLGVTVGCLIALPSVLGAAPAPASPRVYVAPAPTTPEATPSVAPSASSTAPSSSLPTDAATSNHGFPVLRSVTRAGTEYACEGNWGIFDGEATQASIDAMKTWNINAVRIPLNEDCWLGINGLNPSYSGPAYQQAIADYVSLLQKNGMYAVIDLHYALPGTTVPDSHNGFAPMADRDHSLAFWTSVASKFSSDPTAIFELFNEPHGVSWQVWKSGDATYAGMDQLIAAVRATGAENWVVAGGLNYSNDLSGWLAHEPYDPNHKLAAAAHIYPDNPCNTSSCWSATLLPVAQQVPLFLSEVGELDCSSAFTLSALQWAKTNSITAYGPWAWDPHYGCDKGSLISNYDGEPTSFGARIRTWMQSDTGPTPTAQSPGAPKTPPPPTTGLLTPTQSQSTETIASGQSSLALASATRQRFSIADIRLMPRGATYRRSKRLTFPISRGSLRGDLLTFSTNGGMAIMRGRHVLGVSMLTLNSGTHQLRATIGRAGERITLATLVMSPTVTDSSGAKLLTASLVLTSQAARLFNHRLHTKFFHRSMRIGTLDCLLKF